MERKLIYAAIACQFLASVYLTGCGSGDGLGGNTNDVQGQVLSTPFSTTPNSIFVEVVGRTDLKEMATSNSGVFQYNIATVPSDDRVVFKVTGGNVKDTLSFPITITGSGLVNLGFVSTLIFQGLETTFTNQLAGEAEPYNDSLAIVMGRVSDGQRPNVNSVRLVDANLANVGIGPFYFEPEDTAPTGLQLDSNISNLLSNGLYIFLNVPEGNFTVVFSLAGGNEAFDVAVPADGFIFGQELP